ncbi:hypothetical protein TGRH88_071310 [Toxoplasma gondii]|uniref:Uncharacterized protein n=1 Tax=Toxoplasma gondii TaxID=5811 RepID=A0A7J6K4F2_TOXGO|nr:hypothetical protein TGRH88_071310 [Toxoplasma gondii]
MGEEQRQVLLPRSGGRPRQAGSRDSLDCKKFSREKERKKQCCFAAGFLRHSQREQLANYTELCSASPRHISAPPG